LSVGSAQLLRHKSEPTAILVAGLILIDLVIIGAATLGVKGVLLLAAALVLVLIALRLEWSMGLLMVGYALAVFVASYGRVEHLVTFTLRGLVLLALMLAMLSRSKGSLGDFLTRCLRHPTLWITLGFAAVLWYGTTYTAAGFYGANKAMGFVVTGFFYVLVLTAMGWVWGHEQGELRGPREFLRAVWILLCLVAFLAFLNVFLQFDEHEGRLGIPGLGPIWLGRMAGLGILMIPYALRRLHWPRWLVGIAALVFGITLLLTGSRGPVIALTVTIMAVVVDRWLRREGRRQGRRDELILVGAVTLVGVGLVLLPETLTARFLDVGTDRPFMEGFSWKARLVYWGASLMLFRDVGFIGLGTGGFPEALFHDDFRFYPHNALLEVFLENGWPGLILLVLFVVVSWRTAQRLRRNPDLAPEASVAMFLGLFAFGNAMVSGDVPVNVGYWLWGGFLGAMSLAASIRRDKSLSSASAQ
jgi:hypothetical protein